MNKQFLIFFHLISVFSQSFKDTYQKKKLEKSLLLKECTDLHFFNSVCGAGFAAVVSEA